ncbi:hypothetical protein L211DRAFT_867760 [Terfezia boudieri ATCC MYA-4762]|uniref:Uncharacterized protein n=1 Tax=Terfezia boudieri ATCC MYA-4762 TaxID=1051890 RepID=A0A3N4LS62_9PEZI|nr:hypothetical protein L211DRAFT_867760 [Terfezia boudieri ATCC MYA-4762]
MKFSITATIAALVLAQLGFAAPVASPAAADGLEQRTPNPEEDWKTKLGWDGKITPIEEIGEIVSVSRFVLTVIFKNHSTFVMSLTAGDDRAQRHQNHWQRERSAESLCVLDIGPDSGTWCVLYQSTDCSWGGSNGFTNPGLARLEGTYWGQWNDNTGSIKCWW